MYNNEQLTKVYQNAKSFKTVLFDLSTPLRDNYSCDLLAYFRIYPNNTMLFLTPNDRWCDYTFNNQNWLPNHAIDHVKKAYENGTYYFIWPLKPDIKENIHFALHAHGIWNGLTFVKKYYECIELFCFTSPSMSDEILDLYLNGKDVFERFSLHFREKAAEIIQKYSFNNGLLIPTNIDFTSELEKNIIFNKYLNQTPVVKNYLRINNQDIALSKQEYNCLTFLSHGKSIKEIARIYNISSRTVESYINRIKDKTFLTSTNQLISLFHSCSSIKANNFQ